MGRVRVGVYELGNIHTARSDVEPDLVVPLSCPPPPRCAVEERPTTTTAPRPRPSTTTTTITTSTTTATRVDRRWPLVGLSSPE